MKKYIVILIAFLGSLSCQSQQAPVLKFNKDGRFKIAQFTDLHWAPGYPSCEQTTATIEHILHTEKPDMAMLTGDVVTTPPAKEGWSSIIEIFEKARMPFSVVMGNHDAEQQVSREQIYEWLGESPYFLGEKGPEDIYGCGNFVLQVEGSRSKAPAALLYCLDSNDYPKDAVRYGHSDWMRYNQIRWYRQQSEHLTTQNNGKPVPALAFFHIPLPEYTNILGASTTIGNGNRGKARVSPNLNSGFFSSMDDMGDVMGTFVGHIHGNDFIGINHGIALGYGRTTGTEAVGTIERGGRIIELYEGQSKFDTWIITMKGTEQYYYYPSGLSSLDEETLQYLPAKDINPVKQGVNYIYYEGEFESTAEMSPKAEVKRGTFRNFTIKEASKDDYFGYEFNTLIRIPERGIYRFYTYSDDGSKLIIDGNTVVDNDGSHNTRLVTGKVALEAGFHELKLLYFESYMGQELEVGMAGRNMPEMIIPDEMLFLPE